MLMRKLLFIILILCSLTAFPIAAQGQETLAVLDFTTEAVSKIEMGAIVEFLSAELFNTNKYIVIDVSQRETILNEMEFSMSGCSDDTCALEIGKLLSAELIVTGNLSKVGSRYLMSVKLLETETSKTMGTANGKYKDLDELIDGLEEIAFTLAGMEEDLKAADSQPEPQTEPESVAEKQPEPEAEVAEAEADAPVEADKDTEAAGTKTVEPQDGGINFGALITAELGTALMTAGSVFSSFAVNDWIAADDAYSTYMASTIDPGALYSNDDKTGYQHYYDLYERDTMFNYIGSGSGAALSAVSGFMGNNISFGGKITHSAGTAMYAAANVLSMIAANSAIDSGPLYNDYMSAASDSAAEVLWQQYDDVYSNYQIFQYTSYGLLGTAGLLTAASWFFPGEKTAATSGFLEKILVGTGYLLMAGGNFTRSLSVNTRFDAEDIWEQYMSAGTDSAAHTIFNEYEELYKRYEIYTFTSYGLWGAGAAAIITGILIPEKTDNKTAEAGYDFAVRPTLTGLGVEVDIKLK